MLPLYFEGAWARVSATGRFGARGLGSLGAAPGLGPPPGHAVRPRRVGLRPLLPWPRRAATRRRRARAGPFGVQRAGQLLCGRGFCRVRLRRARPCFGARHMSLDRLRTVRIRAVVGQDDCFVLCSGSVSTACCTAGSGGIPTLSAARSHQSHLNSELLRTTSRGELYWQSTAAATPAPLQPVTRSAREAYSQSRNTRVAWPARGSTGSKKLWEHW